MGTYYTETIGKLPVVVTLDQAKKQLKVEDLGVFDDTIIQDCIDSAVEESENYTNTAIYERNYVINSDCFTQDFEFRVQPLQSVEAIKYLDVDGVEQTLHTDLYELLPIDKYAKIIHFKDWENIPAVKKLDNSAVVIEVTCGYEEGAVPKSMQQAIKLKLTDNYNFRGDREQKKSTAADRKLEPFKFYPTPIE
tara:strand:- start:3390 stop:3968 length:579 start_codon:yes stop_codon:yes gene_type:complete